MPRDYFWSAVKSWKDAHGFKIQGEGSSNFCQKTLGDHSFWEKWPGGVPYIGFYYNFICKFCKNLPGRGCCFISRPLVHLRSSDNLSIHKQLTWLICVCLYFRRPNVRFQTVNLISCEKLNLRQFIHSWAT